jgi:hypothetical protein
VAQDAQCKRQEAVADAQRMSYMSVRGGGGGGGEEGIERKGHSKLRSTSECFKKFRSEPVPTV